MTDLFNGSKAMRLFRMTEGLILNQCLCAAAELGIADCLAEGKCTASELATVLRADEDALYRMMRFLAGQGIFTESSPANFANSELSELMRSDVPQSLRSLLIFRGSRRFVCSLAGLSSVIRIGTRNEAPEHTFEHLRDNPEEARIFDEAMSAISALSAADIAAAYDFGIWGSLMDVGGGNGLLLAEILRSYPGLSGVLAEQPHVLERARARGFSPDIADRLRLEPMDFFQGVPAGCRAYMLKNVLHDWDDERARKILLNCRKAVPKEGVLLVVEFCVGKPNTPSLGHSVDIVMLTVTGGRERTIEEHRRVLSSADFRTNRTIVVRDEIILIEAVPA